MDILKIDSTDSTNNWLAENENSIPATALVFCINQRAGRGQRGNSWESEPGKNITASCIFHLKDFPAARQFKISEAIALAIVDYLNEKGVDAKVKWPNDIYVGEKKICGILVEHIVTGRTLSRTIAGFGININQKKFLSDAPNPVSLSQITRKDYNIEKEISSVAKYIEKRISQITDENLHTEFHNKLWRFDNRYHQFRDRLRNENIMAKIQSVAPEGVLSLITEDGEKRNYAFKEIEFILE